MFVVRVLSFDPCLNIFQVKPHPEVPSEETEKIAVTYLKKNDLDSCFWCHTPIGHCLVMALYPNYLKLPSGSYQARADPHQRRYFCCQDFVWSWDCIMIIYDQFLAQTVSISWTLNLIIKPWNAVEWIFNSRFLLLFGRVPFPFQFSFMSGAYHCIFMNWISHLNSIMGQLWGSIPLALAF